MFASEIQNFPFPVRYRNSKIGAKSSRKSASDFSFLSQLTSRIDGFERKATFHCYLKPTINLDYRCDTRSGLYLHFSLITQLSCSFTGLLPIRKGNEDVVMS